MTPTINPFPTIICPCGTHWTQAIYTVCPTCSRWPSGNHSTRREIDLTTENADLRKDLTHSRSCPELTPLSEDRCTCGLEYRKQLATEQSMHAAWRKRAEEAEHESQMAGVVIAELRAALKLALEIVEDLPHALECASGDSLWRCSDCKATVNLTPGPCPHCGGCYYAERVADAAPCNNCPKSPDSPRMVEIAELMKEKT